MFSDLIKALSKKGPVCVLIDEYDRPMLRRLDDLDVIHKIRDIMREFYLVIKDQEPLLNFVLITGLTRMSKAGIFSALNNIIDLSNNDTFACMFGCTREEMERFFGKQIENEAAYHELTRETYLEQVRNYYNGFSFNGKDFVYNPFSLQQLFYQHKFDNYWVDSGATGALVDYGKTHDLNPEAYLHTYMKTEELVAYEIEKASPQSYLVQSGYLTFKGYDKDLGYLLEYPNWEVEHSVSTVLLSAAYNIDGAESGGIRTNIIEAFINRDVKQIFQAMNRAFANIPARIFPPENTTQEKKEYYYHSVLLTLLWASGVRVKAEEWTSRGISDLVCRFRDDIYIIELKQAPPAASIAQIKKKGYAAKYTEPGSSLTLVGLELDTENRTLKDFAVE
jgi:hypothetical protein